MCSEQEYNARIMREKPFEFTVKYDNPNGTTERIVSTREPWMVVDMYNIAEEVYPCDYLYVEVINWIERGPMKARRLNELYEIREFVEEVEMSQGS